MSIFSSIKSVFRKPAADGQRWVMGRFGEQERGWDSAKTTRNNKYHWSMATDQSINRDLYSDLETLRARCHHEIKQNPFVEGMIRTYCHEVVGGTGPTLQVASSSKRYSAGMERAWDEFWRMPDVNGQVSGNQMLELFIRGLWPDGEYLALITNDAHGGGSDMIRLRLQPFAPRRLNYIGGKTNVFMGIELSKTGRPIRYYVSDESIDGSSAKHTTNEYPAEKIIHGFEIEEPGQVRGVPKLASALQHIADLRAYDREVLRAAHFAASQTGVLQAPNNPDLPAIQLPAGGKMEIESDSLNVVPPGWQMGQMVSQQPMSNYIDYRIERMRDIGRAAGMPLMMIRLDSAKHNYSSARMDSQSFNREIADLQMQINETLLSRLFWEVEREARLNPKLNLPSRPDNVRLNWTWPPRPHVDPSKEAAAERVALENGTETYQRVLARRGLDMETVIEQRKAANEALIAAGLPPMPVADSSIVQISNSDQPSKKTSEDENEKSE